MKIIWRRLLTNPTTRIESVESEVVRLRVDGLVCSSVCAVRAKEALEAIPGVEGVDIDFERGVATIAGTPADAATYGRAVGSVVAGARLRRLIEHLSQLLGARARPGRVA